MEEYYNKLYKFLLFDEIIELNTDGKTGELLEKIQRVILTLESCKGDDDGYYFDDPATKKYKIQQLNDRISKITYKTVMLLSELYKDLKQQN